MPICVVVSMFIRVKTPQWVWAKPTSRSLVCVHSKQSCISEESVFIMVWNVLTKVVMFPNVSKEFRLYESDWYTPVSSYRRQRRHVPDVFCPHAHELLFRGSIVLFILQWPVNRRRIFVMSCESLGSYHPTYMAYLPIDKLHVIFCILPNHKDNVCFRKVENRNKSEEHTFCTFELIGIILQFQYSMSSKRNSFIMCTRTSKHFTVLYHQHSYNESSTIHVTVLYHLHSYNESSTRYFSVLYRLHI